MGRTGWLTEHLKAWVNTVLLDPGPQETTAERGGLSWWVWGAGGGGHMAPFPGPVFPVTTLPLYITRRQTPVDSKNRGFSTSF